MLTRRDALQSALGLGATACLGQLARTLDGGGTAYADTPRSPQTRPFVVPLPRPGILDGRRIGGVRAPLEVNPFTDLDRDCAPFVGPGTAYFRLAIEERLVTLHPDLGQTAIWGYRPANVANWPFMLGPTFLARYRTQIGDGIVVRAQNNLPTARRPFGVPIMTTHLHGGHQPVQSDGVPTNVPGFDPFLFAPGQHHDYCYPLVDAGFFTPPLDATHRGSTLWYHDHLLDFTGPNVYRGLAGFFLVFDERDTGDETNHAGLALGLPSGSFDVPLAVQDRLFARDGSLVYNPMDHDGFLGDKILVNGAVEPFLDVKRRKYRFRFLNGSNARFYQVSIVDQDGRRLPFDIIATEGGLLSAPIRNATTFELANAQRIEIVLDFTRVPSGARVHVENRAVQTNGRKPDEIVGRGLPFLEFRVHEAVADPSRVPDVLRPFSAPTDAEIAAAKRRTFEFDRRHGAWAINGELVGDFRRVAARPRLGSPEVWRLVNNSGGWWHPIHVHLEYMQVLRRNGKVPPLIERAGRARRDTVLLKDNDSVEVFLNFRDYPGPFNFHCHNIEHEDMAMMARFDPEV